MHASDLKQIPFCCTLCTEKESAQIPHIQDCSDRPVAIPKYHMATKKIWTMHIRIQCWSKFQLLKSEWDLTDIAHVNGCWRDWGNTVISKCKIVCQQHYKVRCTSFIVGQNASFIDICLIKGTFLAPLGGPFIRHNMSYWHLTLVCWWHTISYL